MTLTNIKPHHTPAAIVGPDGRALETMDDTLWQTVAHADETLRHHGIQMKLICEHCYQSGHPEPFVVGDNPRNAMQYELTCPHARRIYRRM